MKALVFGISLLFFVLVEACTASKARNGVAHAVEQAILNADSVRIQIVDSPEKPKTGDPAFEGFSAREELPVSAAKQADLAAFAAKAIRAATGAVAKTRGPHFQPKLVVKALKDGVTMHLVFSLRSAEVEVTQGVRHAVLATKTRDEIWEAFEQIYQDSHGEQTARSFETIGPRLELLSIEPGHDGNDKDLPKGTKTIEGYRILGSIVLSEEERLLVVRDLQASIREGAMPMACFDPRHAVRGTADGKPFYMLICFTCQQVSGAIGGKKFFDTISPRAKAKLNKILRAAHVPLASE